jgi:hypothetical protein
MTETRSSFSWVGRIAVARAAVTATIVKHPGKRITLRQGVRVIDGSEQRQRERKRLEFILGESRGSPLEGAIRTT